MVFKNCAILAGTTAAGKTEIALEFARKHRNVEIISADSLAVYRGIDIASAKPSPAERSEIPHHLIDALDPAQDFSAGKFSRMATQAIQDIRSRGKRALIVGGTGFYLKALTRGTWDETAEADPALRAELEGLESMTLYERLLHRDELSAIRIGRHDRYRLVRALEIIDQTGTTPTQHRETHPPVTETVPLFVVDRPKDQLELRIRKRVRKMLDAGLADEALRIQKKFPQSRTLNSVGFRQIIAGIAEGQKSESIEEAIVIATRQLAKAQRTWFRGQHPEAQWFELERDRENLLSALDQF